MAETVTGFLNQYLSSELVVFIISMLPILELRGGLVAASLLGVPWQQAAFICIIGNILPIPFILLFVRKVLDYLQTLKPFRNMAAKFKDKAHSKGAAMMQQHPRRIQLALFLFVAIPLPGTGAWTGSLIAAFLGVKIRRSLPAICLGVLGASLIMLTVSYVIPYWIGLK